MFNVNYVGMAFMSLYQLTVYFKVTIKYIVQYGQAYKQFYTDKCHYMYMYFTMFLANITELFGYKYDELYNSVSYDTDEFLTLQKENDCNIELYCIDNVNHKSNNHIHTHDITVEHVTNAITHLKSEKNDNFEDLSSDNFKNGTHLLNVYISLLFSTISYHTVQRPLVCYYQH